MTARQIYLFSFGKMGGGVPTGNISIDTPNDVAGLPGEKVDLYFFNEAPDGTAPNQWEKYGTGTISSDGARILTDVNPATGSSGIGIRDPIGREVRLRLRCLWAS